MRRTKFEGDSAKRHTRFLSLLSALVLMLAVGAGHALVLGSDAANFSFSAYQYAKETLPKAGRFPGTGDDASTTYYVVTENAVGTGDLDLYLDAGLSSTGSDTVLLYVTLTGMAFHDAISAYQTGSSSSATAFSLISGGQKGDTTAILRYTGSGITDNNQDDDADRITIDIGSGSKLGITVDQVGGVEATFVNVTL